MSDESVCQIDQDPGRGDCCCNCAYHIEDLEHCASLTQREARKIISQAGYQWKCICTTHKGWICLLPSAMFNDGIQRAHADWPMHGNCELHQKV